MTERRSCPRPGCGNAAGAAEHGWCDDDRRDLRNGISALVRYYPALREAMVPSSGDSAEPRVGGSRDAPLPLVLEALDLAHTVARTLFDFEDMLRVEHSLPGAGRKVRWTVWADGLGETKVFEGTDGVRAQAMRRLYEKRGRTATVVGEWPTEPHRRNAVQHPSESAQVAAGGPWLLARVDLLLSSPVAAQVHAEALSLHRHARIVLGLASGDVRLPMECPRCGARALVCFNGTEVIRCDEKRQGCGLIERNVARMVRVLVVDEPDRLLPASVIAQVLGIKPRNITAWKARGRLEPEACEIASKRMLYRVGSVQDLAFGG